MPYLLWRYLMTAGLMKGVGLCLSLCAAACGAAAEASPRFVNLFVPFTTETAALSPDGRRLAYTMRKGENISIVALEVDAPKKATASVLAATDRRAVGYMEPESKQRPASVFWMKWAGPDRVVFQSNLRFLSTSGSLFGAIYGFDYNGANARMLFSARNANGPVVAAGLAVGEKPGVVVRGSGGMRLVDSQTGSAKTLTRSEHDVLRRELQLRAAQERARFSERHAELRRVFPGHQVTLFQHHGESERVLALIEGVTEPGFFAVYDHRAAKVWDFVRRAPSVEELGSHRIEEFAITAEDGERFSGCLVLPRETRISRAPVVLWMPERLGDAAPREYQPEIRAIAEMGFAVAVIDGAAAWTRRQPAFDDTGKTPGSHVWSGFERSTDSYLMTRGVDQPAEFSRQVRALQALAAKYPISRKAVALFGRGATARRVLEAIAESPGAVRCVVAIDPKLERPSPRGPFIFTAFDKSLERLKAPPCEAALIMTPRSEISSVGFAGGGLEAAEAALAAIPPDYFASHYAARALEKLGVDVSFSRLEPAFEASEATERAAVFRQVERFLTTHLYRFSVQLGEVKEVE